MTIDRMVHGFGGSEDEFDDEYFLASGDEDEDRWPRPEWLPADCLNVGFALEVGTCCKNPDNPLVGCAVDLADLVDLALVGSWAPTAKGRRPSSPTGSS